MEMVQDKSINLTEINQLAAI